MTRSIGLPPGEPVEVLGLRQRALQGLLAAVAALPTRRDVPPAWLEGRRLDRRVHALVRLGGRLDRGLEQTALARRRDLAQVARLAVGPRHAISVWNRSIDTPDGPLRLRLYRPHGLDGVAPALVFFHGGGWVVGGLDTHDVVCRQLAVDARAVVVSVGYRLAPEHPAPAAATDALAAFDWVGAHAVDLAIDPLRVGVAGDSAGGNLAAIVAQQRRAAAVAPRVQLLIYPAVDMTMTHAAASAARHGYLLDIDSMEWFRSLYVAADADLEDPLLSPLYGPDLSGLAPAIVATAGFDPLRDEGRLYASAMGDAGTEVVYRCYDDQVHGFFSMSVIPSSRAAATELGRLCGAALRGRLTTAS